MIMRKALGFSILLHAAIIVFGIVGLPHLQEPLEIEDQPLVVDIMTVDELANIPKPTPEPEKKEEPKPEPKAEPEPEPVAEQEPVPVPDPPEKTKQPEPEPEPEVAKAEPVAPAPAPKPKPEPKPKDQPRAIPPQALRDIKPKRKPPPPDAFTSLLKDLENLDSKKRVEPKAAENTEQKEKAFQKQMDQAVSDLRGNYDRDRPLSIDQVAAIRRQYARCWNTIIGAKDAENLVVETRILMNPDKTVKEFEIVATSKSQSDPFMRAVSDTVRRAVFHKDCNPLKVLPSDKFDQWKSMRIVFDPSQMLVQR